MHPAFRGLGIMPDAMCQITEKAPEMGAFEVITFVKVNNIPSLKGCKSCGFSPYVLLKETWFLSRKYIYTKPIPKRLLAKYEAMVASQVKKAS